GVDTVKIKFTGVFGYELRARTAYWDINGGNARAGNIEPLLGGRRHNHGATAINGYAARRFTVSVENARHRVAGIHGDSERRRAYGSAKRKQSGKAFRPRDRRSRTGGAYAPGRGFPDAAGGAASAFSLRVPIIKRPKRITGRESQ